MNNINNKIFISKEFVDYFKKLFPNELPRKFPTTPDVVSYLQGQQSVIAKMEFLLDDDQPEEN